MSFVIHRKLFKEVAQQLEGYYSELQVKQAKEYIDLQLENVLPEDIFDAVASLRSLVRYSELNIFESFICNFINQHRDALPSSDLWREIETKYENDVILWRTYCVTESERNKSDSIDNALFILLCMEGKDKVGKKLSILMKNQILGFRNAKDVWFQLKKCNINIEIDPPRVEDLSVKIEFLFDLTKYLVEVIEEKLPTQKLNEWESDTIRDQIDYFIQQFREIYNASPRSARHKEIEQFVVDHPLSIYNQAQAERERMWNEELLQGHLRNFIEAHLTEFSYDEMIRRIMNVNVEDHIDIALYVAWRLHGGKNLLKHIVEGVRKGILGDPELRLLFVKFVVDDDELKYGIADLMKNQEFIRKIK